MTDLDNLNGAQIAVLVEAIQLSFSEKQLGMLLRLRLGRNLADLAEPGTWPERVFEIVEESQRHGFCAALLEAIEKDRPDAKRIMALRQRLTTLQQQRAGEDPQAVTEPDLAQLQALAEAEGAARGVAEGFISEMAVRIAADRELDLDGKMQAVRNAIDLYAREFAGTTTATNLGSIVDQALARAKGLVDAGKSEQARAALRKAAETLRRDEEERREHFLAAVTVLYQRERDIALAAYDAEAAANAVLQLAQTVHPSDAGSRTTLLRGEADELQEFGYVQGSNIHLAAAIELRRVVLAEAPDNHAKGRAMVSLGNALWELGDREAVPARLEEAVTAFRAALLKLPRERVPLDWAAAQTNLGSVLSALGLRQASSARLEEAVTAFRAALQEQTREREPLDWAMTQNNLGTVLWALGEREASPAGPKEAVTAFRAALQERTRERVPLAWAMTQNNLGVALKWLGEREAGTAHLKKAVTAFRAALQEYTCERVPLEWATVQDNLGNALSALGRRQKSTMRLKEAVTCYRAALRERTRERVPLDWAATQHNLGLALWVIGEREAGVAQQEEAVTAFRSALEEFTEERYARRWQKANAALQAALALIEERQAEGK